MQLINEHDMNKTWANYGEKISKRLSQEENINPAVTPHKDLISDYINKYDPTPHNMFGQWIARTYANGGIKRLEDIPSRVNPNLEAFKNNRVNIQRLGHSADINQYKTLGELEDIVEKLPKKDTTKKDNIEQARADTSHFEDEHWNIKVPHTKEAAIHYGAGTRWCTAATKNNMFDDYNSQGPLHIFIPKNPRYPGEKYQYHLHTGSFMDEKDNEADPSKIL